MIKQKILTFVFVFIFSFFQNSFSYLHSHGKDIVDTSGQKVFLRGIGLGGWLVQEGYQLHVPGFGSPTAIRNKIIDLIGEENANQFYDLYLANYVAEKDIEKIASWGFNSIRLPFNYRLLSPVDQPGVYLENGFAVLDSILEWCKKYNLYLILDMHCAPGGQNNGNISDSDGKVARLWTEAANQDRTVEIWQKIAARYANEEMIAGYDLLNETVLPSGHASTELRSLFMRITQAIREVDKNHIVFIEGNWYATDFTSLTPPWDTNLVYSFHKYWSPNTLSTIQQYITIRNQYKVPLWMGESGENSNQWFSDCVHLLEANNISWCWWTHKKVATTTSPYSSPITEKYQHILDYWNGQASKPSFDYARAALFEMAQNLSLEKCDFLPDVLDALFRSDFGSKSIPFKANKIPGKIECVDYDYGGNGVAYNDTDYQNTGGLGHEQWNIGGTYRNDGVDIEPSNDSEGSTFDVGWIENGEWLVYTVSVQNGGLYNIDVRASSPQQSGKFQLFLDDIPLTQQIAVSNTGGWKNWHNMTIQNIEMPEGIHRLKLLALGNGFNLNLFEFKAESTQINERHQFDAVSKYALIGQNYPNPFNHTTRIPVFLYKESAITLKIYDTRGALVKTLFEGLRQPGLNSFLWDATDRFDQPVASGTYLSQLTVHGKDKAKKIVYQK